MARTPKSKTPKVQRTLKAAHKISEDFSNALVRADETPLTMMGAELGLPEIKTLGLMLKTAGGDVWKDKIWTITRQQIRIVTGQNLTNQDLEEICDSLSTIAFKRHENGKRDRLVLRRRPVFKVMDNEQSDSADDQIEFAFSADMRATLARSQHYTVLDLAVMAAMRSKYSIGLYELGKRISRMPNFTWQGTPNELREALHVPAGKMTRMTDLKRYVLKQAVEEIKLLADFDIEIHELRCGRSIVNFLIKFPLKTEDAAATALALANATKAERNGRRKGVETIVSPAPSDQQIENREAIQDSLDSTRSDDLDDEIIY